MNFGLHKSNSNDKLCIVHNGIILLEMLALKWNDCYCCYGVYLYLDYEHWVNLYILYVLLLYAPLEFYVNSLSDNTTCKYAAQFF